MRWPFKRKPKPINPGPINEDWAYGDLAECLFESAGWITESGNPVPGPEKGDTLKVLAVEPRSCTRGDRWFIQIGGFVGWFDSMCFRKVPPLNSEADAEFTAKIKALKPKRVRG